MSTSMWSGSEFCSHCQKMFIGLKAFIFVAWLFMVCGLRGCHGLWPAQPWLGVWAADIDLATVVPPQYTGLWLRFLGKSKCPARRLQIPEARAGSHWSIINRAQSNKLTIVCSVRLIIKYLLWCAHAAVSFNYINCFLFFFVRIIEFIWLNQQVSLKHFHN